MDDQASLTTVLHHTAADSSRPPVQNRLRFRHFQHLDVDWCIASLLPSGPRNPVGSQAPNPVNSHNILNTPNPSSCQVRLDFPPPPRTTPHRARQAGRPQREQLCGAKCSADVCVIGGGIAGCSAALHLAARGYKVALLEARFVGYGASGRSGGQTIFGLAASQKSLVAQVGAADARRLFDLSIEALDAHSGIDSRALDRLRLPAQSRARRDQAAASSRSCANGLGNCTMSTATNRRACSIAPNCRRTCAASAISAD